MLKDEILGGFTGTNDYHIFNNMFRGVVATDGAMYVAKNGGKGEGDGAFWLLEAIASHIVTKPKLRTGRLGEMQFWKLESKTISRGPNKGRKTWQLTCREDSGIPPAVTQNIEFSDFDRDSFEFIVQPGYVSGRMVWVIMLRSEY